MSDKHSHSFEQPSGPAIINLSRYMGHSSRPRNENSPVQKLLAKGSSNKFTK